jgi:hypothetical protein
MATAASTSARRARNEAQEMQDSSWGYGMDMARGATDVWGRSLQASMETMTTMMDLAAQLQREMFDSAMTGVKQSMEMWADMLQGTAERGSARFKDAVDTMADKVKDSTGEIASLAGETANETRQTARSASRAS